MLRARRHRPTNVEHLGLLSGSIALLLLLLAGIGAPRNWWSRNLELSFRTYSAAGLTPGMPVKISGYPVGRVLRINLLSDAQVQVTLLVSAAQQPMIGPRSRASLSQDNLLGGAYIAISPDLSDLGQRGGAPRETTLIYEPSPSLANLIKDLAASRLPLQQMVTNTAALVDKRLPRSLDQLDRTLLSGQRLAGSVERELVGHAGGLQDSISSSVSNLDQTLTAVQTTLNAVQATLSEIQTLARSSNGLLQDVSRSWLMQLLQPAPGVRPTPPSPAPPPP